MATLNLTGFELQTAEELPGGLVGGAAFDTTTKRTGAAALRVNVAASTAAYTTLGGVQATGGNANLLRSVETFFTFYIRFASIPSGSTNFAGVMDLNTSSVLDLQIDSSGNVTLVGATTSGTIATISAGTWYRVDLRATTNLTSGAAIDGGTEQTCIARNVTIDRLVFGRVVTSQAVAFDCYYDDALIDDTAFPGAGEVRLMLPDGAGTYSGWTSGTGTTFAEVDEIPHDSDTSYISASATEDNQAHTFAMQSTATAGIEGTIKCAKVCTIDRTDSTGGASQVGVRTRSGTTDSDTSQREWTTAYVFYGKLHDTDPATAAAWTASGLDAIECGVYALSLAQVQRCTLVAAQVWSAGAGGGGGVANRRRRVITGAAA